MNNQKVVPYMGTHVKKQGVKTWNNINNRIRDLKKKVLTSQHLDIPDKFNVFTRNK